MLSQPMLNDNISTPLDDRIAFYNSNIIAENQKPGLFQSLSNFELWTHKRDVLLAAKKIQETGRLGYLLEAENSNPRWCEGDISTETKTLIKEIKKSLNIPDEVIQLDLEIAEAINIYEKNIKNAWKFIDDENINLWKKKIALLKIAKHTLYNNNEESREELSDAIRIAKKEPTLQTGKETSTLINRTVRCLATNRTHYEYKYYALEQQLKEKFRLGDGVYITDDGTYIKIQFPHNFDKNQVQKKFNSLCNFYAFYGQTENSFSIQLKSLEEFLLALDLQTKLNTDANSQIFVQQFGNGSLSLSSNPYSEISDKLEPKKNEISSVYNKQTSETYVYKSELKKWLADKTPFTKKVREKIEYYENKKDTADPVLQKVLDAKINVLNTILDSLTQKLLNSHLLSPVSDINENQNENYQWVEGKETKALVQYAQVVLLGVPPEAALLDTRIAELINTYRKNIDAEKNKPDIFRSDSDIKLWEDKIAMLLAGQEALYFNGDVDFTDMEIKHPRWCEGTFGSDTKKLMEDIKRFKGESEEDIAKQSELSEKINSCMKWQRSIFGMFNDRLSLEIYALKSEKSNLKDKRKFNLPKHIV